MSETARFAARQAVAGGLATLIVATLRPSQPFLAVLAAILLMARPFRIGEIAGYLAAAWSGIAAGIIVMSLFPQQPWLLFPAFAGTVVLGIHITARYGNPSLVMLMAAGICAALPAGLVHPTEALHAGWDHGWNLTIGVLSAWAGYFLFPAAAAPGADKSSPVLFSKHGAFQVAFTAVAASWAAVIIAPSSSVVLVIAAVTTALALNEPAIPPHVAQKAGGAVLGAMLSIVFVVIVAGAGNSFSVFLAALMVIFAGFACCARRWTAMAACFMQGCAMFSVAAPMLPAPDVSLAGMGSRIVAILVGFGTAAAVYGFSKLATSATRSIERQPGQALKAGRL